MNEPCRLIGAKKKYFDTHEKKFIKSAVDRLLAKFDQFEILDLRSIAFQNGANIRISIYYCE